MNALSESDDDSDKKKSEYPILIYFMFTCMSTLCLFTLYIIQQAIPPILIAEHDEENKNHHHQLKRIAIIYLITLQRTTVGYIKYCQEFTLSLHQRLYHVYIGNLNSSSSEFQSCTSSNENEVTGLHMFILYLF